MDVTKLKVVELRAELAARGLDQKGNKPILVARLQEAMDADLDDKKSDEDVPLVSKDDNDDPGDDEDSNPAAEKSPTAPEETSQSAHEEAEESVYHSFRDESESKEVNDDSVDQVADESSEPTSRDEESCEAAIDETSTQSREAPVDETSAQSREAPVDETSNQAAEESSSESRDAVVDESSIAAVDDIAEAVEENEREAAVDEASVQSGLGYDSAVQQDALLAHDSNSQPLDQEMREDAPADDEKPAFDQNSSSQYKEPESMDEWQQPDTSFQIEDSNAQDALDTEQMRGGEDKADPAQGIDDEAQEENEKTPAEGIMETDEIKQEESPAIDENGEVKKEEGDAPKERRRNRWGDADATAAPAETAEEPSDSTSQGETRAPMDSEQSFAYWSRKRERTSPPRAKPENEPYYDEKEVILSWYDSDLHLIIDKDNFYSATLNNHEGFGYVWAGVRSTYGFEKGKIFYQVKISDLLDVSANLEDEPTPHALRVGWSALGSGLQLGEEPLSYGYGSTGKISCDSKFDDYGKPFTRGDIIGCYLDLDSNPITMTFTHNGEDLGVAYSVDPEQLKAHPLFPHVLSKNCAFHVNFGEQEPWSTTLDDYTFLGKVPIEDRVLGPTKPASKGDCEVIMMVGLPGSGKTTWADKYAKENPEKKYNILGTNALLDKMKVMGIPRRRNYHGRWENLIAKCTKCLNTLLELAASRRRNYIIDQTNVYPTAQRRKMRGFEGFQRRAVVIVPSDQELLARVAKREAEEGKDVPDSAVLEMKANFALPDKELFDAIEFVELDENEAVTLVQQYNKEGNDAGFETKYVAPYKKPRLDDDGKERYDRSEERRSSGGYGGYGSGGYGDRGGFRGGMRGMRGRPSDRGFGPDRRPGGYGGGGYRNDRGSPRGGGGSWRGDRDQYNRRDDRGGWNGGGGRGNWRDNRGGGGSSGWGGQTRYPVKDERGGRGGSRGGRDDRSGDRDKRNSGGSWNQGQQGQQGYGWGSQQGYGNQQQWGNWQGYQQGNQWKGYQQSQSQQPQQQQWGQQGWGQQQQQQWANWNQQYYNQGWGQQGWATTGQQAATGATAAVTTDATQMAQQAYNYANTGQAGQGQMAQWQGYGGYGTTPGATAAQQGVAANAYNSPQK